MPRQTAAERRAADAEWAARQAEARRRLQDAAESFIHALGKAQDVGVVQPGEASLAESVARSVAGLMP